MTTIQIAYTPDSDDAFYYFALETGRVTLPGVTFNFTSDHIIALNRQARQSLFDVVAVSSVAYPDLYDQYRILSVGTSVGRGYGPVLVSRKFQTLDDLRGRRVGVAGLPTTGGFLAMYCVPDATLHECQFDRIADAVVAGEYDAGVMIHEELLYYPQKGLHAIADLGAVWQEKTSLPLPVGLNVISRRLESSLADDVADVIRESLCYALANKEEALRWATRFGRGMEGECGEKHIEMFANEDSVMMPADVRRGLRALFPIVRELGISERVPPIEIVEGSSAVLDKCLRMIAPSTKLASA